MRLSKVLKQGISVQLKSIDKINIQIISQPLNLIIDFKNINPNEYLEQDDRLWLEPYLLTPSLPGQKSKTRIIFDVLQRIEERAIIIPKTFVWIQDDLGKWLT